MSLATRYLGLSLKNPVVPSASPLSRDLGTAKRLEDAGASALVMYSLFEEELKEEEAHVSRFLYEQDIGHPEADDFLPLPIEHRSALDRYQEHVAALKRDLDIPVIASLNGVSTDGWVFQGKALEEAGADALELNVYYVAADPGSCSQSVEARYTEILTELRSQVRVPITMKLSPFFSSLPYLVKQLELNGANGVSLFNRFYEPNIDLETLELSRHIDLSRSADSLLTMRWIAILRSQVALGLAATGGVHTAEDALKQLLVGADVVHLCSALLKNGPGHITTILDGLESWLETHEYTSVEQLKGSLSQARVEHPAAFERANYVDTLRDYRLPASASLD